jgi:sulfur carrier protein ThiS
MQVSLRLLSSLCIYGPKDAHNLTLPPGESAAGLAARLGIPADELGLVFVNGAPADPNAALSDGDAVLLLPPISGG